MSSFALVDGMFREARGNFGHAGVKGHRGGSAPKGGASGASGASGAPAPFGGRDTSGWTIAQPTSTPEVSAQAVLSKKADQVSRMGKAAARVPYAAGYENERAAKVRGFANSEEMIRTSKTPEEAKAKIYGKYADNANEWQANAYKPNKTYEEHVANRERFVEGSAYEEVLSKVFNDTEDTW